MKKFLSVILAAVMLISATVIPASAYTYTYNFVYGKEIFAGYDIYDLLDYAKPNSLKLDVTNHVVLEKQTFNRIKNTGSSIAFAPYKFTLKKKDTITVKGTVAKLFETYNSGNGICVFLFNDDDVMYYDANDFWFTRNSKYDSREFEFTVEDLPKGNYYMIFATGGNTKGDFELDFKAKKSVERKPEVSYTVKSNGNVKLKWNKVKGATKYRVCKLVGSNYKTVKKSTKKTSYTIKGLTAGNVYKYGVKAYVNGKWTSLSVAEATTIYTTRKK